MPTHMATTSLLRHHGAARHRLPPMHPLLRLRPQLPPLPRRPRPLNPCSSSVPSINLSLFPNSGPRSASRYRRIWPSRATPPLPVNRSGARGEAPHHTAHAKSGAGVEGGGRGAALEVKEDGGRLPLSARRLHSSTGHGRKTSRREGYEGGR